jgi:hypothetical protein
MPIHKCLWHVFGIGSKGQTAAKLDVGLGSTRFKCSGLSLWLSGKAFSGVTVILIMWINSPFLDGKTKRAAAFSRVFRCW